MSFTGETLLLRAHGGREAGAGHVMRLFALGLAWRAQRGRAVLLVPPLEESFARHLTGAGLELRTLQAAIGGAADARETLAVARETAATWLVADGYVFRPEFFETITAGGLRLAIVDDGARSPAPAAELIVDPAFQARVDDYRVRSPGARLLLGPGFALLRPEFQVNRRPLTVRAAFARVLVTMGGSDPTDASGRMLRALASLPLPPREVVLVVGGLNPRPDEHFEACAAGLLRLELHRNVTDMAALLCSCDGAIAAGGSTVHELAALGLPALLTPVAENQVAGLQHVAERGWFSVLPPLEELDEAALGLALAAWLADPAARALKVAEAAVQVDGRGAERVCRELCRLTRRRVHQRRPRVAAVLGAGPEQLAAIRTAQGLGVRVLAFDRNPTAPGLAAADEAVAADPADQAAVETRCREAGVEFLLPTPMGALLGVAGRINDSLRLPGLGAEAARLCTDKLAMRTALATAGLAQPACHLVDEAAIRDRAGTMGWPVILKPRFGSGSHGVVVMDSPAALTDHLDWHRRHARRGGESDGTLVEGWVPGPEFGLDAAMVRGRFHAVCLRRKEVTPLPFRLALGVRTPPGLNDAETIRLLAAAERACRALGLDDCLVHVDLILEAVTGRVVVIELSGRPSGFRISSHFVPCVKGFDPVQEMIQHLLGEDADFTPRREQAGLMRMLALPVGCVTAVAGLARARAVPGVVACECPLQPGDVIGRADAGSAVLGNGYLLTTGATLADAERAAAEATACLQVEVKPLSQAA